MSMILTDEQQAILDGAKGQTTPTASTRTIRNTPT